MDHIDELFLNVHRLSKHTTTAVGINGSEYTRCAEGRRLQAAIDQAVEYFRSSADWFWSSYRQVTTTATAAAFEQTSTTTTSICCDAPWLPASPEEECGRLQSVLDSGVGSIAEHIYLGTNFVPPNDGGGYDDDDVDDTDSGLHVNVDAAIEQMNNDYDKALTRLD